MKQATEGGPTNITKVTKKKNLPKISNQASDSRRNNNSYKDGKGKGAPQIKTKITQVAKISIGLARRSY